MQWGDKPVRRMGLFGRDAACAAGAKHVCVQPLLPEGAYRRGVVQEQVLDLLAPLSFAHTNRGSSVPD